MVKNYLREAKEITELILNYFKEKGMFSEDSFYTIEFLVLEDEIAQVKVCDDFYEVVKKQGNWCMPAMETL